MHTSNIIAYTSFGAAGLLTVCACLETLGCGPITHGINICFRGLTPQESFNRVLEQRRNWFTPNYGGGNRVIPAINRVAAPRSNMTLQDLTRRFEGENLTLQNNNSRSNEINVNSTLWGIFCSVYDKSDNFDFTKLSQNRNQSNEELVKYFKNLSRMPATEEGSQNLLIQKIKDIYENRIVDGNLELELAEKVQDIPYLNRDSIKDIVGHLTALPCAVLNDNFLRNTFFSVGGGVASNNVASNNSVNVTDIETSISQQQNNTNGQTSDSVVTTQPRPINERF